MPPDDYTEMGGGGAAFPTTHWSKLEAVRDAPTAEQRSALDFLIRRYWKPCYCYLRRRGHSNEDAKDLVQEFFTFWLSRELFGRADPSRGRFRAFLLACLDRFVANVGRAARAQKRLPLGGVVSVHDLVTDDDAAFEPPVHETPEAVFQRAWATELLRRVLRLLERECQATSKQDHYELFRRRILEPALEGAEPPPLRGLAQQLALTEKEAANRLLTVRRAYQRLLRVEIRLYAASEDDIASELRDLFALLAGP